MPISAEHYHFLSLCLLYPQADLAMQLRQLAQQTGLDWALDLATAFAAESPEDLQVEHTRLFVNNAGGIPCPPYESAYVDGHLMSATTATVAAFYAEWGLEQSLETADFLPVELQFAAYLIELAAQAEGRDVEAARRRFEAEHLARWLPKFAADLQQHAQQPFYKLVGKQLATLAANLTQPV